MKNTEAGFYSFKQYLLLDVYMDIYHCTSEVMKIELKYFVIFPCTWKIKLLNTSKTKAFLAISRNVSYVRYICFYVDIGGDDYDDYDDGESSNEDYYK